jgi:hypothetical protein
MRSDPRLLVPVPFCQACPYAVGVSLRKHPLQISICGASFLQVDTEQFPCHFARSVMLGFNGDEADPRREISPGILPCLLCRSPQAHTRPLPHLAFYLQSTADDSGPLLHAA